MELYINKEYVSPPEKERLLDSFSKHCIICNKCNPYISQNIPFKDMCDIGFTLYGKLKKIGYKFPYFAPREEK